MPLRPFPAHIAVVVVFLLVVHGLSVEPAAAQGTSVRAFYTDFNSVVPIEFMSSDPLARSQAGVGGYAAYGFSGSFIWNRTGGEQDNGSPPGKPTVLELHNLPPHKSIDLNFLLGVIDTWDGNFNSCGPNCGVAPDQFNVVVGGNSILSTTFEHVLGQPQYQDYVPPPGVQLVRNVPFFSRNFGFDGDSAYNMSNDGRFDAIPHTGTDLRIEWFANGAGWQGGSDESWAIDNVEVILNGAECPVDGLMGGHVEDEPFRMQDLTPDMQQAVMIFQETLRRSTGMTFQPTSGHRSESLQLHFVDIRDAYKRLGSLSGVTKTIDGNGRSRLEYDDSAMAQVCEECINDVNEEIQRHGLTANSDPKSKNYRNPAVNNTSSHTLGIAVDFSIGAIRQHLNDDQIESIALASDLKWFRNSDVVHFEFDGALNNGSFDDFLDGWKVQGLGSATAVEDPAIEGDLRAELTAGSPVELSDRFDVPDSPSQISFNAAFLTGEGQLDVFLDSLSIGGWTPSGPEDSLSRYVLELPAEMRGSRRELRFVFDGPSGAKMLLDDIRIVPIPEPSTSILIAMGVAVLVPRRRR